MVALHLSSTSHAYDDRSSQMPPKQPPPPSRQLAIAYTYSSQSPSWKGTHPDSLPHPASQRDQPDVAKLHHMHKLKCMLSTIGPRQRCIRKRCKLTFHVSTLSAIHTYIHTWHPSTVESAAYSLLVSMSVVDHDVAGVSSTSRCHRQAHAKQVSLCVVLTGRYEKKLLQSVSLVHSS